jgi:hypothetical protein
MEIPWAERTTASAGNRDIRRQAPRPPRRIAGGTRAPEKTRRADKDLPRGRYNRGLPMHTDTMEAEQLNALANTLDDLTDRAGQLRRYL